MNPCQSLHQHLSQVSPGGTGLERFKDHLRECSDCSERVAALRSSSIQSLYRVSRPEAPRELAGRVVAALHAGYRQDRATEEVATVGRLSAPDALALRVQEECTRVDATRRRAPLELDHRVDRDLRGRPRRRRPALVAAMGLILLSLPWWMEGRGPTPEPAYSFTVHDVQPSEFKVKDPAVRSLVSGWTGGFGDADPR